MHSPKMMDSAVGLTVAATILLMLTIPGTSANVQCGIGQCPDFIARVSNADSSLTWCCEQVPDGTLLSAIRPPYCCTWMDYFATRLGMDPEKMPVPMGAIIGMVVGGLVLVILLTICCCFCCGLCCFSGRRHVITTHRTVGYGKA